MCQWMGISQPASNPVKDPSQQTEVHQSPKQSSHLPEKKDHSASPVPMINFTWMAMAFTAAIDYFGALFLLVK